MIYETRDCAARLSFISTTRDLLCKRTLFRLYTPYTLKLDAPSLPSVNMLHTKESFLLLSCRVKLFDKVVLHPVGNYSSLSICYREQDYFPHCSLLYPQKCEHSRLRFHSRTSLYEFCGQGVRV